MGHITDALKFAEAVMRLWKAVQRPRVVRAIVREFRIARARPGMLRRARMSSQSPTEPDQRSQRGEDHDKR